MLKQHVTIDPERVLTFMGIGALWIVACMCFGAWEVGRYLCEMATDVIPPNKSK